MIHPFNVRIRVPDHNRKRRLATGAGQDVRRHYTAPDAKVMYELGCSA